MQLALRIFTGNVATKRGTIRYGSKLTLSASYNNYTNFLNCTPRILKTDTDTLLQC